MGEVNVLVSYAVWESVSPYSSLSFMKIKDSNHCNVVVSLRISHMRVNAVYYETQDLLSCTKSGI